MVDSVDDDQLTAIIASNIRDSLGYESDQLAATRTDNLARYEGEAYGDEREGRSSVMSRDVLETAEMVMPSLMHTFLGNESAAVFEPVGPEDEAAAEQATDYVNHVLMRDNEGFRIAVDVMKSALITGTSVCKLYFEDIDREKEEMYSGLSDPEFMQLVNDENVEVLEHTAYGSVGANEEMVMEENDALVAAAQGQENITAIHDVKIKYTEKKSRLRWEAVPPEEFLVNKRARTLDEDDNTWSFCCHRQARTVDDLEEAGYDKELIESASSYSSELFDETFQQRFEDLETVSDQYSDINPSQRRVFVYECYLKVKYKGANQLRRVTVLGGASNTVILENEHCDELPFAEFTAIRRPHRLYGYSLADLTKDLQRLKTALWRSMMDGLYLSLYPHKAIDESRVELDDLLSEDPGSIYRVNGDPRTAIVPLSTQWSGAQAFPMMQYIDAMLQKRTGVNDLAGGMDASSLTTETARGVDEMANAARARVELICRQFAETGWRRLMRLALQMLNRHQDQERVVRMRGEWVNVDPRSWNSEMDVQINVGLGVGTRTEQVSKLNFIAAKQEQLMSQMGITNPVAPLNKYYNTLKKLADAADLDPNLFFTDPTMAMQQQQGQQPPPNPELVKAQQKMELAKMEAQSRLEQSKADAELKARTDRMKAESEAEVARFRAELEAAQARETAELKAAVDREVATNKLTFEYEKMQRDHEYRMSELQAEKDLEREKMIAGSRDGQGNINVSD